MAFVKPGFGFAQPSNLELTRAERSRIPNPAGNFDCAHVLKMIEAVVLTNTLELL